MPHIKINQPRETYFGTMIEVDGQKINGVRNIDYHVGVDGQTGISIDVVGTADVDIEADYIKLDISPVNVESAIKILRSELSKNNPRCEHLGIKNELREAFTASIWSVLNEYQEFVKLEISKGELAEKILDRLLGDEEQCLTRR